MRTNDGLSTPRPRPGAGSLLVRVATALLDALRRWFNRRSDRTWQVLLTVASWFAPYAVQRRQLRDMAAIMHEGPPFSLIMRRIVADTSREELQDAIWALRHLRPMDPTRWDEED